MSQRGVMISFRLTEEQAAELATAAARLDMPRSILLRAGLAYVLDQPSRVWGVPDGFPAKREREGPPPPPRKRGKRRK